MDQPAHGAPQRARFIHHRERATDQEDQEDDIGRVCQPLGNRDDGLEETNRGGLDLVEGARYHHAATGDGVVSPFVLTRGQHIAHRGGQEDTTREQRERMRKAQLLHPGTRRRR